jgi:hypothetical protein
MDKKTNLNFKKLYKSITSLLVAGVSLQLGVPTANAKGFQRTPVEYNKTISKTEVVYKSKKKEKQKVKEVTNTIKSDSKNNIKVEDLEKLVFLSQDKLLVRKLRKLLTIEDKKVLKPVLDSFLKAQSLTRENIKFMETISREKYIKLIDFKNITYSHILSLSSINMMRGGKDIEARALVTWLIILLQAIIKMIQRIEDLFEIIIKGLVNFINNIIRFLKNKYNKLNKISRIILQVLSFSAIAYYIYSINLLDKIFRILYKNKILSKLLNLEHLKSLKTKSRKKFKENLEKKLFELSLKENIFPYNGGLFLNKSIFTRIFYTVNPLILKPDYVINVIKGVLFIFIKKDNIGLLLNNKINWKKWISSKNCSNIVKNFYQKALKEAKQIVYENLDIEKSEIWRFILGYNCSWIEKIVKEDIYDHLKGIPSRYREKFHQLLLIRTPLYDLLHDIGKKIPNVATNEKLTELLDIFLDSLRYESLEPLERLSDENNIEKNKESIENKNNNKSSSDQNIETQSKDFNIPKTKEEIEYLNLDLNNDKKDSNN